jgi:hypothetical protein
MPEAKLLNKQFEFIMPLQKSKSGIQSDGFLHIEFAISNTDPDLQGDQMTVKCLESMAMQAKGLSVDGSDLKKALMAKGINIDDNHFKGVNALIGPVTDAWVDQEKVLWVDLRVRKEWEKTIKDLIDSETQLGGSIQGSATEILEDDDSGIQKIDDVFLTKAALTDTPANWSTRGTARLSTKTEKTCYGSMCSQINKSLNLEKIKKSDYVVNQTCLDFAKEQIASDNVNNGPWTKPLFADFDNKIDEYKKYALAVHPDMDEKLAGSYGFEIGKNGKIYRQGVIAAKTTAAGGMSSAGKNTAIYNAADDLLTLIDKDSAIDKSKGGDTIKKTVISVDDAFETIQAEINEALDDKYGTTTDWGVSRDCYIAYTTPDFVVVSTYDSDIFQIPYTRADNGKGDIDVTLADPVPADLQLITKALKESKWMVKSIKPENGGDKLKDKIENIPEGMDKTFVEKVKGLGDEGKDFIKGLLTKAGDVDTDTVKCPDCGALNATDAKFCDQCGASMKGTDTSKSIDKTKGGEPMQKEDVQKMLNERDSKFEKTLKEKDEKIKSLETRLDNSDEKVMKKTNKELLSKSLELHKKLKKDMTPEEESTLVNEIKTDLEEDNGSAFIERDIKTMEKALEELPAHDLPFTGGKIQKELSDKYAQQAAEGRAKIEKMGTK